MNTLKNIEVNKRRIVLVFFGILISFIKNKNYSQSGGKYESLNSCDNIKPLKTKNRRFEGMFKILSIISKPFLSIFLVRKIQYIIINICKRVI